MNHKTRRQFLRSGAGVGMISLLLPSERIQAGVNSKNSGAKNVDFSLLDEALNQPVLKKEYFPDPIIIEDCELMHYKGNFLCRVRSKDGAVGYCVSHNVDMPFLWSFQVHRINPFFIGKDARDLDQLVEDVTMHRANYKYQGYALWIPIATVEIAILDMLGRIAKKSMGELIGQIHNKEIAIYQANNNRGKSAEESIENIKKLQSETNARAVKFKIGGRRNIPESPQNRTEKLIPLMRKSFGDDITIYADANGSYNVKEGIRIGQLLEENRIDLYEQPVPTDWYDEWKEISQNLKIPIASGGGEISMRCFRWLIENEAVQMVQQDLFYFGGMIRCMKVARMAAVTGGVCTPHISGTGLGYVYMMQFVSAIPNAGPFHEFKGLTKDVPFECSTSTLKPVEGILHLPTGIGSGVDIDPDFIAKHKVIVGQCL